MTAFVIPFAHGLGGRTDLPLPGWVFAWGAAVVLAVSFLALASLWTEPKLETAEPHPRFKIPAFIEPLCGAIGLAVFAALVYFGFAGNQNDVQNLVPTFIYVFFWSMLPLISGLFGDVFRPFNPWRAVGLGAAWLRAQRNPDHRHQPPRFNYPDRLGRWPAVIGVFAFGWLELISGEDGRKPAVMMGLALGYAAFQLVGMSLFGARRWLERGDGFGVYFNFFSRIAPLTVEDGRFATRRWLSGLTDITPLAGTVAFVSVMIGITIFDGSQRGGVWKLIAGAAPSDFLSTFGLLGCVLVVAGFFRLGVAGMKSSHIDKSPRELGMLFAPSLIPIALGYIVAHYFSFMIFVGQALPHVIAHPMGNSGPPSIDYFMSSKAIWYVQVFALLAGHVCGLIVAHDKAIAVWGRARAAAQSQMWMLVVMVGFTCLGLWLLSQSPSS